MGATDRVRQYIDFKGITRYKFCRDLGFSNKFLDNSSNMGTDKACKILRQYPDINPEWLITGDGDMLRTPTLANTTIASEPSTTYIASSPASDVNMSLVNILAQQAEEIGRLKAELAQAQAKLDELDYLNDDDAPDVGMPPSVLAG